MFKLPLLYLTTAPKHKSGDAGSLDVPKGNHKVLLVSEKVNVFSLRKERKKKKQQHTEVAMICGKNRSSVGEIVKKDKTVIASFAVEPHTAKVTGRVSNAFS